MANQEHVKLLKQGSAVWNAWRQEHPEVWLDLRDADLSGTDLSYTTLITADFGGADLHSAELISASLIGANLTGASLRNASLIGASLRDANLGYANLSGADLSYANLSGTNLNGADLSDADIGGANLSYSKLRGANFQAIHLASTTFAWVDLRTVEGLDKAIHDGPSIVDVKTVQFPEGDTRVHFLRGVGFSDAFIDYLPALFTAAIQYASCFISYAHQDEALAQRLYKDLQARGVRCWFAPEDMKIGDKIRVRIDKAIHLHDKLLLILSSASVTSDWVEHEVEMALAKERKEKRTVLFPIRVDRAILDQEGQGWPALVRYQRHIGDFTNWTNPQVYQVAFDRLLRDLKQS